MSAPKIPDDSTLEEMLSAPTDVAIEALQRIEGDIMLLGAGGKMGPSLARMTRRASQAASNDRRVIAVSRFSNALLRDSFHAHDVETIGGDLLDNDFLASLPSCPNVIFMTGAKFGTSDNASMTWAMNVLLPARVAERFRESRLLAFSTGNVYPHMPVSSGGSTEADELLPVGEYGMSALGRERMFEYASSRFQIPTSIVRLNYAVEMRYGVVVDLAQQVLQEREIDVSMGHANVIWQGDANAMALAALADGTTPPYVVNVAGPELLNVQQTCERFGQLFNKRVTFHGKPAPTALLSNGSQGHSRYGLPRFSLDQIIDWTADWLKRGGTTWQKPTHFEVRSGKF